MISDAGGMPELVQHGHSGLVVSTDNPVALARALTEMYENPPRRRHLGKNGRTRIQERFNIQSTIAELIELFERLV